MKMKLTKNFLRRIQKKERSKLKFKGAKKTMEGVKQIYPSSSLSLRFKGLIRAKVKNNFVFSYAWEFYFLKRACKLVEHISLNRGIIFIVQPTVGYKNYAKGMKSGCIVLDEKVEPGFLTNPEIRKKTSINLVPDLIIYLKNGTYFDDKLLNEALSLKIPVIAPIQNLGYKNIPYPLLVKNNLFKISLFFWKNMVSGLFAEKKQIKNVKKKKI